MPAMLQSEFILAPDRDTALQIHPMMTTLERAAHGQGYQSILIVVVVAAHVQHRVAGNFENLGAHEAHSLPDRVDE